MERTSSVDCFNFLGAFDCPECVFGCREKVRACGSQLAISSCCSKETNQCPCMLSICFKVQTILYILLMFWAVYVSGPGFNKQWGYHLLDAYLVMLLCTVVLYVLAQSFLFGHIKSYFLKNKVIWSTLLGHKKMALAINLRKSVLYDIRKV